MGQRALLGSTRPWMAMLVLIVGCGGAPQTPGIPTNVRGVYVAPAAPYDYAIVLTWDPVAGAEFYDIFVADSAEAATRPAGMGNRYWQVQAPTTTYADHPTTHFATLVYYAVSARVGAGGVNERRGPRSVPIAVCTSPITCSGRQCGTDGCGASCGTCVVGQTRCDESGQCMACTPGCAGRQCGTDACGQGHCGDCVVGLTKCDAAGQCVPCAPGCGASRCGTDDCGNSCGDCPAGTLCIGGQCSVGSCSPNSPLAQCSGYVACAKYSYRYCACTFEGQCKAGYFTNTGIGFGCAACSTSSGTDCAMQVAMGCTN